MTTTRVPSPLKTASPYGDAVGAQRHARSRSRRSAPSPGRGPRRARAASCRRSRAPRRARSARRRAGSRLRRAEPQHAPARAQHAAARPERRLLGGRGCRARAAVGRVPQAQLPAGVSAEQQPAVGAEREGLASAGLPRPRGARRRPARSGSRGAPAAARLSLRASGSSRSASTAWPSATRGRGRERVGRLQRERLRLRDARPLVRRVALQERHDAERDRDGERGGDAAEQQRAGGATRRGGSRAGTAAGARSAAGRCPRSRRARARPPPGRGRAAGGSRPCARPTRPRGRAGACARATTRGRCRARARAPRTPRRGRRSSRAQIQLSCRSAGGARRGSAPSIAIGTTRLPPAPARRSSARAVLRGERARADDEDDALGGVDRVVDVLLPLRGRRDVLPVDPDVAARGGQDVVQLPDEVAVAGASTRRRRPPRCSASRFCSASACSPGWPSRITWLT